ncbi:MAG: ATP-binding protein [Halioglobus sp.]
MNSIRARLVTMLIAAFTLVTFLASLNGYKSSMAEAEKLMDSQLQNALSLLSFYADSSGEKKAINHSESGFAYQVWRNDTLLMHSHIAPSDAMTDFSPGYRYANFAGARWRVLTESGEDNYWYMVAERADQRHKLAEKVVLESIVPLLWWLPISGILIWLLVGLGLRPLSELRTQINQKRSDDLQPLVTEDPPNELLPLIDSTNSLLSRLEASFEREKHFAAHAAHELRTPLSGLKVHLHNLSQDVEPGHKGLQHANLGLQRMQQLVEQILDLNRTNPETIRGTFHSLDLHMLVQRVMAEYWPVFAEKSQNLSLEGDKAMMLGDESALETLLRNLLANANKYVPVGGEILVSIVTSPNSVRLQVEDSGPGITDADKERVFERFYRAAAPQEHNVVGAGLGLAIVEHIAHLHHAEIRLGQSQFESGLLVNIDFPVTERVVSDT